MPVIPKGVPGFVIRAPSTSGDKGEPTSSVRNDAHRVFALIEDERHLTAHKLYQDVTHRIQEWENHQSDAIRSPRNKRARLPFHVHMPGTRSPNKRDSAASVEKTNSEMMATKRFLETKRAAIKKLENKCRLFRKAQQNLNVDDDWTFACHHFGVTTFYRREDDGSLSLKLEGEVEDVPLFEQVCVIKEVDLHYKWSPFCTSSMTIADLDKLDVIGWFMIGVPTLGMARDGCFRAISCDNIAEDGTIVLAGQGVKDRMPHDDRPVEDTYLIDDPVIEELDIPVPPSKRGSGRLTIRKFEAVIRVNSATSATTRLVANVDPNISFMPQSMIEWVMKNLAGVLLARLQNAAKKIPRNPVTNEHARKMREEEQFYKEWLMKKFEAVCYEKGWDLPAVTAFELTDEQLRKEMQAREQKARRRLQTYTVGDPEVVESMSLTAHSTPPPRPSGDGSVSELSSRSGLSRISQPLKSYLREIEQRTQRRKDAAIAESRRVAAERLRPKDLPIEKQERLEELRKAKARKLQVSTGSPKADSNVASKPLSFPQRITVRLYSLGKWTRFFVVSALLIALFVALYPEPLVLSSSVMVYQQSSWSTALLADTGSVLYILLCGFIHFALCDVALVYAFESLDLGSKAGRQAKKFYGDNVHSFVGWMSAGIVGLSILKAAATVWLRTILYQSIRLYIFLHRLLWRLQWVSSASDELVRLVSAISSSLSQPINWMVRHLILSNFVGWTISAILNGYFRIVASLAWNETESVTGSTEDMSGNVSVASWRVEAFETARSFFSYTAVFLMSVVVLFSLSAKANRSGSRSQPPESDADASDASRVASSHVIVSTLSSLSDDDGDFNSSSRRMYGMNTPKIPEDEELFDHVHDLNRDTQLVESAPKRRRPRWGRRQFRREKTEPMEDGQMNLPSVGLERPSYERATTF